MSNLDTESSLSTYGHPIVIGGPAICSADTSKCPATNQRGETRKEAFFVPILAANHNITVVDLDGACDIGAMEFSANN